MSAKVLSISFLQYISRAGHEIESPTPSLPTRTLTVVINAAELENKENMEHKVRRGTLIPGKNYMLALMQRTPDICTFCKVELLPFFPSFAFRLQIGKGISSKSRKKTLTERLNKVDKSEMKREGGGELKEEGRRVFGAGAQPEYMARVRVMSHELTLLPPLVPTFIKIHSK